MARKKQQQNKVRIIAGQWRGQKIGVTDSEGLRPTSDRIRETLFNWLQTIIPDSVCIDCFAGSGALGFEAASRGAKKITLIETNHAVVTQLKRNREKLAAENIEIILDSAEVWLQNNPVEADIIFLDPPFSSDFLQTILNIISDTNTVRPDGVIYLEYTEKTKPVIPHGWQWRRQKRSGNVSYGLLEMSGNKR